MQGTVTVSRLPICIRLRNSVRFTGRSCPSTFADCSGIGGAVLTSPTAFFDTTGAGRLVRTPTRRMLTLVSDYITHFARPCARRTTPCLLRHTRTHVGTSRTHGTVLSCSTCCGTIGNGIGSVFCCCHRRTTLGTGRCRHTLSSVTGTVRLGPRSLACHTRLTIIGLHIKHCRRTLGILGATLRGSPGCTRTCHLVNVTRLRVGGSGRTYTDFTGTGRLNSPGISTLVRGRYGWESKVRWELYFHGRDLYFKRLPHIG